ncbi:MAG TPA: DUF2802 domain-containing protein [Gammaproteobacteria bacterium]|nr:DUF2802 domain-containing protein [Gammaproteobacteria bacterium]
MSLFLSLLPTSLLAILVLIQWHRIRRLGGRLEDQAEKRRWIEERTHHLEQELAALCNASLGAGEHLLRLEKQMQRLADRQNALEMRAATERPYGRASQLIDRGAGIDELVDTCGLTRGEAELLVMMQRGVA